MLENGALDIVFKKLFIQHMHSENLPVLFQPTVGKTDMSYTPLPHPQISFPRSET